MKKELFITWILLLLLTIFSALISTYYSNGKYLIQLVMLLAALKFIGIAFNFMELKKSHIFWKTIIIAFITLFFISLFFF